MRGYILLLVMALPYCSCVRSTKGCTDPRAENYELTADEDDGSCTYESFVDRAFVFIGNKTSGSGTMNVTDTFYVTALESNKLRLAGLLDCDEVIVESAGAKWNFVESHCQISNWQFTQFEGSFNFMGFRIVIDSIGTIDYSGEVRKI